MKIMTWFILRVSLPKKTVRVFPGGGSPNSWLPCHVEIVRESPGCGSPISWLPCTLESEGYFHKWQSWSGREWEAPSGGPRKREDIFQYDWNSTINKTKSLLFKKHIYKTLQHHTPDYPSIHSNVPNTWGLCLDYETYVGFSSYFPQVVSNEKNDQRGHFFLFDSFHTSIHAL